MLSFKAYLTEKKSKVLINPKKDDLKEVKKEHGEDCDCMKCEKDRRKNDVNDGPDVQNEAAPLAGLAKAGAVIAKGAKVAAKVGKVAKKAGKVAGVAASVGAGVGAAMSSSNSNNNNSSTVDEAKVDQGRSDYGKASIRNYRRSGPGHGDPGMFDPEGKRGKTIDKRREEHKARRGVKGAKVPAYKREETEVYWSSKALDQLEDLKEKDTALDIVKKKIIAKYGKGAIMSGGSRQQKKVKGQKDTRGTGKYKKMADQKKQTASDAKKRGFKDVQSYVNTMARYGGKDNYDKGKGLGT